MPNAIERLRELLDGEPMEPDIEWSEACAEWLHENGAAVDALHQAAKARAGDGHSSGCKWYRDETECECGHDALAAAVRRVEGQAGNVSERDGNPPTGPDALQRSRYVPLADGFAINPEHATPDDPHGAFGAPGMMGG